MSDLSFQFGFSSMQTGQQRIVPGMIGFLNFFLKQGNFPLRVKPFHPLQAIAGLRPIKLGKKSLMEEVPVRFLCQPALQSDHVNSASLLMKIENSPEEGLGMHPPVFFRGEKPLP